MAIAQRDQNWRKGGKMRKYSIILSVMLILAFSVTASATNVPGTSDPWLAGMPNTSQDNLGTPEPPDTAPAQSPVLVINVTAGTMLQWTATGRVGHPGDVAGPDGAAAFYSRYIGANNGISDITSHINALLGVFIGPSQPGGSAPTALDFSVPGAMDYLILNPLLQQVFFMGDGLTGGGQSQTIVAPSGATRLYLGTMDGYGWANNIGSFEVTMTAVPEPFTILLLGLGLVGIAGTRRIRK